MSSRDPPRVSRPLIYNAFVHLTPNHHSHGYWRTPEGRVQLGYKDLEPWVAEAEVLERGRFDTLFIADVVGTYDLDAGDGTATISASRSRSAPVRGAERAAPPRLGTTWSKESVRIGECDGVMPRWASSTEGQVVGIAGRSRSTGDSSSLRSPEPSTLSVDREAPRARELPQAF